MIRTVIALLCCTLGQAQIKHFEKVKIPEGSIVWGYDCDYLPIANEYLCSHSVAFPPPQETKSDLPCDTWEQIASAPMSYFLVGKNGHRVCVAVLPEPYGVQ